MKKRTLQKQQINIGGAVIVYIGAFLNCLPLLIMIIGSFKKNIDLIKYPMNLNPFQNGTLKNLIKVFTETNMLLWFKNSVVISGATALLTVFIGLSAGYALAKIKFRGKTILFVLVMATMMMPKQLLMVPNYLVARQLNLVNSLIGVVLTTLSPAFAVFMSRQFISSLPSELFDYAEVDGCTEIRKFFNIVVPLSLPVAATVGIFSFFGTFNDYIWQLIMLNNSKLMTMPVGVATFTSLNTGNVALQLAAALVSALPLVIVFFCCQKMFIKGATAGAIKG